MADGRDQCGCGKGLHDTSDHTFTRPLCDCSRSSAGVQSRGITSVCRVAESEVTTTIPDDCDDRS